MPNWKPGPNYRTPFGVTQYRGSTAVGEFVSRTFAATSIPSETIDGNSVKWLRAGTLLARITSAAGTSTTADIGKVGPWDPGASDGRQTAANIQGYCDTELPWQLMEGDENVSVLVRGTVVQANCRMLTGGAFIALTNTAKGLAATAFPGLTYHVNSLALTDLA